MAGKKEGTEGMSPSDYKRILIKVQLREIALAACSVKTRLQCLPDGETLKVFPGYNIRHDLLDDHTAMIYPSFNLVATPSTKKEYAISLQCTFRLTYYSQEELTLDFLEIFMKRNVPLNAWPYFREFVQNMTQRMNIPPLVLPLIA